MAFEVEAARGQVERLLQSKTFETSEVHRRLLLYLAEKTFSGEAERLKEYTIGLEAFGKPSSYDPRHDSIVRLQTGRLRQKLLAYYQTEASNDPLLVSLPKGAFKLSFEPLPNGGAAAAVRGSRTRILILGAALVLALLWAVLATAGYLRLRKEAAPAAARWSPDLEKLWAPFLESQRPFLVCLGTPLFVRFPNYGFFRDPKANDWQEMERSERVTAARRAMGGEREILPWYAFTGAGEASAAFLVAKLLSSRRQELLLTRSNLLSWQQIVDNDVVFVGPPKFNRQLQAAALTQDIVVEADGVRNLKPRPGEPEFLRDEIVAGASSEGATHALISRTPGLSGVGELLVIAGNASSDTFAAAEWLTQPLRAKELVERLRAGSPEVPRYFQAVLRVEFKQGIPVRSRYVFHHVLNPRGATPGAGTQGPGAGD